MKHPINAYDEFDRHRPRLNALAYRMLGSWSEAEDAVQEAWIRAARADSSDVGNVAGWLTTIAARVCLNMLRARATRREDPFDDVRADPTATVEHGPEFEAALAESVSAALLVVLETLDPAERLAFVLHDMFAMPFHDIAVIVDRSTAATRQLASRARRRVQGHQGVGDGTVGIEERRRVVDAFFAAARLGRLDQLLVVLDPDIVLRTWTGPSIVDATVTVRGAESVAGRALRFAQPGAELWPVVVQGRPGVLATVNDTRITLMVFQVGAGVIIGIDALIDPVRLVELNVIMR
jgi:RNA polymerase sigma factor (sigma-70 family)